MIRLAAVIETFEADFMFRYRGRIRREHLQALSAMKHCRTEASPKMLTRAVLGPYRYACLRIGGAAS